MVAIHGLNGDAQQTWTHRDSGVLWLRDILPAEIPAIRVLTYGYDARIANFTGQQHLRSISIKLISELVDLRRTDEVSRSDMIPLEADSHSRIQEKHRPIVLVCHSLGGIVAKKVNRSQMDSDNRTCTDKRAGFVT